MFKIKLLFLLKASALEGWGFFIITFNQLNMIFIKEIKVKFPKWKWWQYGLIIVMIILAITKPSSVIDILVKSGMPWL
ncbi:hypothetical protein [Aquimarina celericrescens]|uniref:Uncharacterized protein n=1 Tax=Aquimarina celericrescens TaxID=1964542 RepID=A0ABW5ATW9_9FLAO|nr:hypothetical protein [Aquimarina celericrescens]MBQ0735262.1 hypothetical protein [Aquimarina celericrescens]